MSYDDPAHWHVRAKEMLARAGQMDECATKHVLRGVADVYEFLALTAEQRAKRFPSNQPGNSSVVPADVRQFAPRKNRLGPLPATLPSIEIPSFLKRGPKAAETQDCRTQNENRHVGIKHEKSSYSRHLVNTSRLRGSVE
jgi:hypothetical protein